MPQSLDFLDERSMMGEYTADRDAREGPVRVDAALAAFRLLKELSKATVVTFQCSWPEAGVGQCEVQYPPHRSGVGDNSR